MKIGIIREDKVPVDRRTPFTPDQCKEIMQIFPGTEVLVQPSEVRCFPDSAYRAAGLSIQEDLSECAVLFGVKEVPKENLLRDKTYLFFSHTIKKQAYNRDLLRKILAHNIQLLDYEVLTDESGARVVAFGRYAGLVGAYNAFRTYGLRHKTFELKPAHLCADMEEMLKHAAAVKLPALRIVLTGKGRVSQGAEEVLKAMGISEITVEEYLSGREFSEPVFTALSPQDYNEPKDGSAYVQADFYRNGKLYRGTFGRFTDKTDILIAGAYWDPSAPVLFREEETKKADFRIKIIADITCDIEGSIPTTKRPSTIAEPFYDYDPATGSLEKAFSSDKNISVMAVDNLPCELPVNASQDFGRALITHVLPSLLGKDTGIVERASVTKNGKLTERFSYLQDYVEGK